MRFGPEILRGVRVAAILFAAILAGIAGYRMLHVTESRPAPSPAPAASVIVVPPDRAPAARVHRIVRKPPVVKNVKREEPPPAASAPVTVADRVTEPSVNSQLASAPNPPKTMEKPEPRRKRVIKALGRFLHIGGNKEVQPETVRQP
jgi:hypothetical protein